MAYDFNETDFRISMALISTYLTKAFNNQVSCAAAPLPHLMCTAAGPLAHLVPVGHAKTWERCIKGCGSGCSRPLALPVLHYFTP